MRVGRQALEIGVEAGLVRQRGLLVPLRAPRASARIAVHGLELALGDTARKLPSRTTLSTPGSARRRAASSARSARAVARRAHDARVHHAGQAQVLHVGRRRPSPWPGCRPAAAVADDGVARRVLQAASRRGRARAGPRRRRVRRTRPAAVRRPRPRRRWPEPLGRDARAASPRARSGSPAPARRRAGSRCRCPASNGCPPCSPRSACGPCRR